MGLRAGRHPVYIAATRGRIEQEAHLLGFSLVLSREWGNGSL